jgi:hypothetical protein
MPIRAHAPCAFVAAPAMNACAGLTGAAAKTEALISVPTCEFSKPAREARQSLCDLPEQLARIAHNRVCKTPRERSCGGPCRRLHSPGTRAQFRRNATSSWFGKLTMRTKPLKTHDLILSLSKDEAKNFQSAGFVTGKILHINGSRSVGLTPSLSHIAP